MNCEEWSQLRNVLSELDMVSSYGWMDGASREKHLVRCREELRRILVAYETSDDIGDMRSLKLQHRVTRFWHRLFNKSKAVYNFSKKVKV